MDTVYFDRYFVFRNKEPVEFTILFRLNMTFHLKLYFLD